MLEGGKVKGEGGKVKGDVGRGKGEKGKVEGGGSWKGDVGRGEVEGERCRRGEGAEREVKGCTPLSLGEGGVCESLPKFPYQLRKALAKITIT